MDGQFWWVPVVATLLGGSVTAYLLQQRRQSVRYRLESTAVVPQSATSGPAKGHTLTQNGTRVSFTNLHIVQFDIANKGNKAIETFVCGLTMPPGALIVAVSTSAWDEVHEVTVDPEISLSNGSPNVVFSYKPFNRGGRYSASFLVSLDRAKKPEAFKEEVRALKPSTKQEVRFSQMRPDGEVIVPPLLKQLFTSLSHPIVTVAIQQLLKLNAEYADYQGRRWTVTGKTTGQEGDNLTRNMLELVKILFSKEGPERAEARKALANIRDRLLPPRVVRCIDKHLNIGPEKKEVMRPSD